ncbi:MAG: HAD family phosphatase [Treponema sp.]|nr:HAD family phosphatase [Treponema sp.]
MNNIKAIVFDMDGVLLDSETICDRCWQIAAKEFNIKDSTSIIRKCLGTNKTDSIQIIKNELGQDFDSETYLKRTSELFHQIEETEGVPLMPYVKECLEYLKGKYRLALASSTREVTVRRQLTQVGIINYFETLTTGDMVTHSKPEPDIYIKACKSLGVKPEECIAIEDSPNGIKSGYAAGLKTIMVPDKIQPFDELMPYIWKVCKSLKQVMDEL